MPAQITTDDFTPINIEHKRIASPLRFKQMLALEFPWGRRAIPPKWQPKWASRIHIANTRKAKRSA